MGPTYFEACVACEAKFVQNVVLKNISVWDPCFELQSNANYFSNTAQVLLRQTMNVN